MVMSCTFGKLGYFLAPCKQWQLALARATSRAWGEAVVRVMDALTASVIVF